MTPPKIQHSPLQVPLNIAYNEVPINLHSRNIGVVESHTDPGTGSFPLNQHISLDDPARKFDNKQFNPNKTASTPQP